MGMQFEEEAKDSNSLFHISTFAFYTYWRQKVNESPMAPIPAGPIEKDLDYWVRHLSGAPASVELPTDHRRPAEQKFTSAEVPVQFSRALQQGEVVVLAKRPAAERSSRAAFDFQIELRESDEGLEGTLEYDRSLFEPATIERLVGRLRSLARAMCVDPLTPVDALSL